VVQADPARLNLTVLLIFMFVSSFLVRFQQLCCPSHGRARNFRGRYQTRKKIYPPIPPPLNLRLHRRILPPPSLPLRRPATNPTTSNRPAATPVRFRRQAATPVVRKAKTLPAELATKATENGTHPASAYPWRGGNSEGRPRKIPLIGRTRAVSCAIAWSSGVRMTSCIFPYGRPLSP